MKKGDLVMLATHRGLNHGDLVGLLLDNCPTNVYEADATVRVMWPTYGVRYEHPYGLTVVESNENAPKKR